VSTTFSRPMLMGLPRRTRIRLDHAPHEDEATYLSHVDAWGRVVMGGKRATPESLPPILKEGKSRTPTDHAGKWQRQVEGQVEDTHRPRTSGGKSRTPTDHELPRDFPGDAFAMATLASIGASEQKAAKHGDTKRTHRR
jgi:hypothetical protein